jgi:Mor family transcriptional regulator
MAGRPIRSGAFLQEHRRIAERCLQGEGIDQAAAARIADRLQAEMQRELGGVQAYIGQARRQPAELAARAAQLRDQGLSVRDVAGRLGLSESYTYWLLRRSKPGRR